MSAANRSRPAANGAAKKWRGGDFTGNSTRATAENAGLQRRRDAALRLPPLPSGERDPLFDWGRARPSATRAPGRLSRSPIRVEFDTPRNTALVRGFGGGDLCRFVGGRGTWIESRRGWSTSARTARDVIAAAERDGRPVIITEAGGGR